MAPKETKKDRERRLKKAEELTTVTNAPTDGPTDDDEPDEERKGGLMRPGTSAATAAAVAPDAVASALISTDSSDADGVTMQEEKVLEGKDGYAHEGKAGSVDAVVQVQVQAQEVKEIIGAVRRSRLRLLPTTGAGDAPPPLRVALPHPTPPRTATGRSSTTTQPWSRSGTSSRRPLPKPHVTWCPRGIFPLKVRGRSSMCVRPTRGRKISG
jgi:hypothetical protein